MAILNFPTSPVVGQTYTIPGTTTVYTWSGTAWLKTNNGNQVSNVVTATTIVVGTGTSTIIIGDGNIVIGGSSLITTATTSVVRFLNDTESTSTTTGAVIITGGLGVGKRINSESLRIADTVFDSTVMTVNTLVATVIDTFSFNDYRSAKYVIQIDEGTTSTARCQATEMMLLVTNTGTVNILEYGNIMPDGDLGNFEAAVNVVLGEPIVTLSFISPDADVKPKTVKVLRTAMAK